MTVFLTSKKVLVKQNKFTFMLYQSSQQKNSAGARTNIFSKGSSGGKSSDNSEASADPEDLMVGIQVCRDKAKELDARL